MNIADTCTIHKEYSRHIELVKHKKHSRHADLKLVKHKEHMQESHRTCQNTLRNTADTRNSRNTRNSTAITHGELDKHN